MHLCPFGLPRQFFDNNTGLHHGLQEWTLPPVGTFFVVFFLAKNNEVALKQLNLTQHGRI